MPYQGPNGYIPPGQYGGRAFPTGHAQQVQMYPPNHLPQQQYQNFDHRSAYNSNNNNHSQQTQYTSPQFYDQGQPQSFYQAPAQQYQQPQYLSPPLQQTTQFPEFVSPDPLHYYQPGPQPRRDSSLHGHSQQQQQQQRQHQHQQQQQPPQRTPSQHHRPSTQVRPPPQLQPQSQQRQYWPTPGSAVPAPQQNVAATVRNAQVPAQQQRQHSQPRPSNIVSTPTAPSVQRQGPPDQQSHYPKQPTPVTSARPPPSQAPPPRSVSQTSTDQIQYPQRQPQDYQQAPPGTIDPRDMQRNIAHVQLPAQHSVKVENAPKRRKSNDGQAVAVCTAPSASQQESSMSRRLDEQPRTKQSSSTQQTSSQLNNTPTPSNLNYQAVLLSLCDEYTNAAYSMSANLSAADVSDEDLDRYHCLLATGMGCLESVLRNYHISDPRKEARIRLRLASLLYEETDNDMEAEEILTKGISICERAKLHDLKYAMHHLLARIWFKGGKVKAALKAVEKLTVEVEKWKMIHWVYTFRFLRVTLGLQVAATIAENAGLIKNLSTISQTAEQHGHVAVQIMASLLEALIHLRTRTPDSVDLAQRALAIARRHQLSPEMTSMPRFQCLLDFLDLSCSLLRFNFEQLQTNTDNMQKRLDSLGKDSTWTKDGGWQISFGQLLGSSSDIDADTGGMLRRLDTGECAFRFRWLAKPQVHTLGFLLAGLSAMNKNASHERKAEAYFGEGIKLAKHPLDALPQSLSSASAQYATNSLMLICLRLYAVFACCGRCDWQTGLKGIASIRASVDALSSPPEEHITSLISYLEAVCRHGLGELEDALRLYQIPELQLQSSIDNKAAAGGVYPIRVLAALNSVMIIRHNGDDETADRLLKDVQDACLTNPNSSGNEYGSKSIEAAFFILKAMEDAYKSADNVIIKTKQYLNSAVQAARGAVNNQLLCIVMNIMTDLFFTNIVGDQAEKSAKAARSLATKSQDKMWKAVADEMYANTLEKTGRIQEAENARQNAQDSMQQLPESLKAALLHNQVKRE